MRNGCMSTILLDDSDSAGIAGICSGWARFATCWSDYLRQYGLRIPRTTTADLYSGQPFCNPVWYASASISLTLVSIFSSCLWRCLRRRLRGSGASFHMDSLQVQLSYRMKWCICLNTERLALCWTDLGLPSMQDWIRSGLDLYCLEHITHSGLISICTP